MIDILIPVLGRPERAKPLADNIKATTTVPWRIWWIISYGEEGAYNHADHGQIFVGEKQDSHQYPRKINEGYRLSGILLDESCPYVFNASDDLEFTPGWAEALLAHDAGVVASNDMANSQVKKGQFGTHCLIRRSYIDEQGGSLDGPGTVFHEGYDHNFCDRELCHLAQHRGVFAFARNAIVKHHHPLHDSHVKMDRTYRKGLAGFHEDQLLFFERAARWDYEGLNPQERRVARNRLAKAKR